MVPSTHLYLVFEGLEELGKERDGDDPAEPDHVRLSREKHEGDAGEEVDAEPLPQVLAGDDLSVYN